MALEWSRSWNVILLTLINGIVLVSGGKSSVEDSDHTGSSPGATAVTGSGSNVGLNPAKYSASFYPSNGGANYYSAYGYPSNFPYGYNHPQQHQQQQLHSNHYNIPEYERNGKDFSTRASNTLPVGTPNFGYSSKEGPEFAGMAMASGGNHGHGHGHGQGWDWGKGHHGSKVDTSAIGLLGLIGLLSLLSSVLNNLTTTAAAMTMSMTTMATRRKRRSTEDVPVSPSGLGHLERVKRISLMVLPHLNVIAHARDGRVPLECTHREVCLANSMFVKELGIQGRSVGHMMSNAISKLLKEADRTGAVVKHLSAASLAGRSGGDCLIIYPLCPAMKRRSGPLPLLMPPKHLEQFMQNNGNQQSPISYAY